MPTFYRTHSIADEDDASMIIEDKRSIISSLRSLNATLIARPNDNDTVAAAVQVAEIAGC